MTFTHSFEDVTPFARFDDVPWETVRVEESLLATGPWTEIANLSIPVDATPDVPDPVNLTVVTATLEAGYFRFRFDVSPSNPSPYTSAIYSPSTTLGLYYATPAQVRNHLGVTEIQMPDEMLERPIRLAQDDIDAACGGWVVYEDTGLKFASVDLTLTSVQVMLLSQATCEQVEYRLTVGDDFLVREQYETQSGPGYGTSGQLRKVTGRAYSKLSQGGFLRLTSRTSNTNGRAVGDLPRAN